MEYFVRHRTTYRYLQDVSHSWHLAHLRPRTTPLQAVHDSSITLSLEAASRGTDYALCDRLIGELNESCRSSSAALKTWSDDRSPNALSAIAS